MTAPHQPPAGGDLPSRRAMRENGTAAPAAAAAPNSVDTLFEGLEATGSAGAAETASPGRRLLIAGAIAGLGAGAVALATSLASPDSAPFGLAGRPDGVGVDTASGHGASGSAGATATSAPKPTSPAGAAPGAAVPPSSAPKDPGLGAPREPSQLAPTADWDASAATAFAEQHVETAGYDPQLPAGLSGPIIQAPVANTPEAARHLLRRAGYGIGSEAEAEIMAVGIDAWLGAQLDPSAVDPSESTILSWFPNAARSVKETEASIQRYAWDAMYDVARATLARQIFSKRQIFENVVDLMHSVLHVTIPSEHAWNSGADYVNKVVRAHAFGKFRDMLLESARQPAMLRYLSNVDTVNGELNENYGRELLELHTVGVSGGYTEDDVLASAKILSGRRIDRSTGEFVYEPKHHISGPVRVLDFTAENADPAKGLELGDEYIAYLASHPSTARTLARRFAVRFITDMPSDAVVQRLADVYLANDTDLLALVAEIFRTPEFWQTADSKIRRPLEDAVGVLRSAGASLDGSTKQGIEGLCWALGKLGHAPLAWPVVNGYPDVATAWMSASQLIRRWNLHRSLLNGWVQGVEPSPEFLTAITPSEGAPLSDWVDAVCVRTLGVPATEQLRAAAAAFLNADLSSKVTREHISIAPHFAALVFNSPTYAIR